MEPCKILFYNLLVYPKHSGVRGYRITAVIKYSKKMLGGE
jgi:hypothetical protein